MTDLKISTLTLKHVQLLKRLWASTFEAAYQDVHSAENIAAYCASNFTEAAARDTLSHPDKIARLAGNEANARGYYVLHQHLCPLRDSLQACELKQIYLLPQAYGTGLGKVLFTDAVREAKHRGADFLWLSVSEQNFRAQKFYRKLKFQPLGRGPDFRVGTDTLTSQILGLKLS